ncbi:MAG TPA: class I SAM-dependent methyltransferase [Candidatus Eremiobacteraceae bacterium]|nr:class I SAM-dependent methyltransferase [Candidatus Eremiobacteraceae bacterium]
MNLQFQSDFDTLAVEYEQYRTSYSDTLFDAILAYAGPLNDRRALDLACGTGLSTRGLVARGVAVTGIDVAANMLEVARRSGLDDATFYEARAEALPFADNAFALVTCGQAFHWFDGPRVLAEIERVLVPGGAHAQYWKHYDATDPFVKAADDLERAWSGQDPNMVWHATGTKMREWWQGCGLVDRERRESEIGLPFTIDSFIGYESSRETLRLALGERRHDYLVALRAMIEQMAPSGAFSVKGKEYLFLGRRKRRT